MRTGKYLLGQLFVKLLIGGIFVRLWVALVHSRLRSFFFWTPKVSVVFYIIILPFMPLTCCVPSCLCPLLVMLLLHLLMLQCLQVTFFAPLYRYLNTLDASNWLHWTKLILSFSHWLIEKKFLLKCLIINKNTCTWYVMSHPW